MSPSQVLFDQLFIQSSEKLGYDTYASLPREGVPYPFVVIGNVHNLFVAHTDGITGRCSVDVHVFGDEESRATVDEMISRLVSIVTIRGDGYVFHSRLRECSSDIVADDSVPNTKLWHGYGTLVVDWFKNRSDN